MLGRAPEKISLLEVVEAVEGTIIPNRCVIGDGECSRSSSCNVHPVWIDVQSQVRDILAKVTLKELGGI
jgi:DNA-binding IscR family transcriptional regulator